MRRVHLVHREPIAHQQIGDALDGLARDTAPPRHLGNGGRRVGDGIEHHPAGQRLTGDAGEGLAGGGEQTAEPGDLEHERGEAIAGGRTDRPLHLIDNMLSICVS